METKELIKVLQSKETELRTQLDSIRQTIKVLMNNHSQNGEGKPQNGGLKKRISKPKRNRIVKSHMKEKIIDVLTRTNRATVKEIFNEIAKNEKVKDNKKFIRSITMVASQLYKAGKIKATKEGIRNIYYLKDNNPGAKGLHS